jgi:hypothetical protein
MKFRNPLFYLFDFIWIVSTNVCKNIVPTLLSILYIFDKILISIVLGLVWIFPLVFMDLPNNIFPQPGLPILTTLLVSIFISINLFFWIYNFRENKLKQNEDINLSIYGMIVLSYICGAIINLLTTLVIVYLIP